MKATTRSAWCALGLLFLALLGAPPKNAAAVALRQAKNFVLPGAETIHDDLYVAGTVVDIQGTVDGDLFVGGQTITIGGTVTGDVFAMGRDVTITGNIGGTVRAAGNAITVDGTVGHDVLAGCGALVIGPNASVGRDVLAGAGNSSFGGRVARDVRVGSGSTSFSGSVGGVVYARAKELKLNEGAVLEGDLFYISQHELTKSSGAIVKGRVERREPAPETWRHRGVGGRVIGWFRGLIGLAILGALFHLLFAHAGPRTLEALGKAPWESLGIGVLLAFGFPCAAAFLFILGLIFGGWWIALGGLVLYFFALALGYVVSATYVGRWLLGRAGSGVGAVGWALLAGLAALGLVTAIPFLGNLVGFAAALFGMGALAMAWYRARRGDRQAPVAPPAPQPQSSAT
jgi:cytoskeletal protein CcmA (bactofilin family)